MGGLVLLVDAVMLLTALELLGLAWWYRRFGRGVPPHEIRLNLCSGLALMGALRAALSGASSLMIMLLLLVAGFFHALDIRSRWRR
ncbi:MAG: hypothetical protein RI937_1538 [Pseudomonadota bacterium]|jgi:hypothetical protein